MRSTMRVATAVTILLSVTSPTTRAQTRWAKTFGDAGGDTALSVAPTVDGGLVLAGTTTSFGAVNVDAWVLRLDATGSIAWQRTLGGSAGDYARDVIQTSDGGFAVAGTTASSGAGDQDVWVVKLDASGSVVWQRTFGGTSTDQGYVIVQTSDGGFGVAGATASFGAGSYDVWVLRLDASGTAQWQRILGDVGWEAMVQTSDGGFAIAATTSSFGVAVNDFWVVKLDASGNVAWQKTIGGGNNDFAESLAQMSDGSIVVVGSTPSFGAGGADVWVVKLDASGGVLWERAYGGAGADGARGVVQLSDGSIAVGGYTDSYGAGSSDVWLLDLNAAGTPLWQETIGGPGSDWVTSLAATSDGGVAVAGLTDSFGAGATDFLVARLSASGGIGVPCPLIGNTYASPSSTGAAVTSTSASGGSSSASIGTPAISGVDTSALAATQCTGIAPPGEVSPSTSLDPLVFTGKNDLAWEDKAASGSDTFNLYRGHLDELRSGSYGRCAQSGLASSQAVDNPAAPPPLFARAYGSFEEDRVHSIVQTEDEGFAAAGLRMVSGFAKAWAIRLDPAGNALWQKTYGGSGDQSISSIVGTSDGGFVLAGNTNSFGSGSRDFWVLKLDGAGDIEWQRLLGGAGWDVAYSVIETSGGGYAVAGYSYSFSSNADAWLLRLDALGNVLWQKRYDSGSSVVDVTETIIQTSDGGFAMAGTTTGNRVWVARLDASGNIVWQKRFSSSGNAYGHSILETSDGGFAVAATMASDLWVARLDGSGNIVWHRLLGGGSSEAGARFMVETSDGGIVVTGETLSYGKGNADVWLLKLDAAGSVVWQRAFGGALADNGYGITRTFDGGLAVAGRTESFGGGAADAWILRLDQDGLIDASCTLVTNTPATPTIPALTAVDALTVALDTTGNALSSAVSPVVASAAVNQQCAGTLPGAAWFYLVTGENAAGEGTMGFDSAGAERTNQNPCP